MDRMTRIRSKQGCKTKRCLHMLLALLFILFLFLLNPIFCSIYGRLEKVKFENYTTTSETKAALDNSFQFNDLGERISLRGWAFSATSRVDDQKSICILLVGDQACYKAETLVSGRADVTKAFCDSMDIYGDQHGFQTEFSTLCMGNGVYDLYAYCKENDKAEGVVYLNYSLIKNNTRIEITENLIPYSRTVTPIKSDVLEKRDYNKIVICSELSTEVLNEYDVDINGWCFCETEEPNNDKAIFVLLKSEGGAYSGITELVERKDVYEAYKDKMQVSGVNHGFQCRLNLSALPKDTYEICIFCCENENAQGIISTERLVTVTANGIEILEGESKINVQSSEWTSTKVDSMPNEIATDAEAKGSIDNVSVSEGRLRLQGWSFAEGHDCANQTVYLHLKSDNLDAYYATHSVARKDVAEVYSSLKYEMSGFISDIQLGKYDNDSFKISILVDVNGRIYEGLSYNVTIKNNVVSFAQE